MRREAIGCFCTEMRWMLLVLVGLSGCAWTNAATVEAQRQAKRQEEEEQRERARWWSWYVDQLQVERTCGDALVDETEAGAAVRESCASWYATGRDAFWLEVARVRQIEEQRAEAVRQQLAANEAARRERARAWGAVAAGLNARAQAQQAPSYYAPPPPPIGVLAAPAGCTSDYECTGLGQRCVRKNSYTPGQCMKMVDQTGLPSLEYSPKSSTGTKVPYEQSCTGAVLMCPIGFRCDRNTGACIR